MSRAQILAQIDAEINQLQQARQLLAGGESPRFAVRATGRRQMSAASRKRISDAQKARWAKVKAKKK